MRPSIQMEKKIAFMPPSRMRGMSTLPSALRLAISSAWAGAINDEQSSKKEPDDKHARRQRISVAPWAHSKPGPNQKCRVEILTYQPAEHGLFPRLTIYFRDGFGERNFFWACL